MIYIPGSVGYNKIETRSELNVTDAYPISVPDGWMYKKRFLDYSELIYVTEGELHLLLGDKEISLQAGDAYIIRRYTILAGARPSKGTCGFYTVSFDCGLQRYEPLYSNIITVTSRASYAETLLTNLSFYSRKQQESNFLADTSFLLFLELLNDCKRSEPEKVQMHEILKFIDENISTPFSTEEVAKYFHYNSDYLSKKFRSQFGLTLKQYLIEKRLTLAKHLLTTSDISIPKVAQAVGFPDPVLFEKFFKYHLKITPRKYRELYL